MVTKILVAWVLVFLLKRLEVTALGSLKVTPKPPKR